MIWREEYEKAESPLRCVGFLLLQLADFRLLGKKELPLRVAEVHSSLDAGVLTIPDEEDRLLLDEKVPLMVTVQPQIGGVVPP